MTLNKTKEQNKISAIGFDLTEDINKQAIIDELHAKAVQASRLAVLGELAAGVAHEINNPLSVLTSVTFLIQRLIERNQMDQVPQRIEQIKKTINRISRIVTSLRMYARDGEQDPFLPADIEQIIYDSLELCIEGLKNQSIEISFKNLSNQHFTIHCRDTQISQVILNLISNAKDAIAKNGSRSLLKNKITMLL
jgi:C4-dicarboxylate-specific signal transduction histidine kinase